MPTPDRAAARDRFLRRAGWAGAERHPLAGDASARRYLRLSRADGSGAVLMDADPETGEDTRRFLRVARFLHDAGFSAPRILDADPTEGFLLLEDLGDALLARLAETEPHAAPALYAATGEMLAALHRHDPPADWPRATPERLADAITPVFTHYGPDVGPAHRAQMMTALRAALAQLGEPCAAPVLRDVHAENLIWLPERQGPRRLGLLDFQDAVAGHPAYDLASLVADARRDVSAASARAAVTAFAAASGRDRDEIATAMAVLGTQRNLRILGIFARLASAGKPRYVDLMPRVWRHIDRDLAHPALAEVRAAARAALPPPDPARRERLRRACPTP